MTLPAGAAAIPRALARDAVYSRIRQWILDGELQPGERLRDAELAAAFGVSRMPIREALLRLESEGLVEVAASRWIRVAGLPQVADDIYPIVWTLEVLALRLAGELPEEVVEQMAGHNRALAEALELGDARAAGAADDAFHREIVGAAGSRELARLVDSAKLSLRRWEQAYFAGLTSLAPVTEHDRLLEALRAHDQAEAAAALEANWRGSLERFHAAIG